MRQPLLWTTTLLIAAVAITALVVTTGRSNAAVSGGIVLYSSVATSVAGWDGHVNRTAYVNGLTTLTRARFEDYGANRYLYPGAIAVLLPVIEVVGSRRSATHTPTSKRGRRIYPPCVSPCQGPRFSERMRGCSN